jgi:hypothetical protein
MVLRDTERRVRVPYGTDEQGLDGRWLKHGCTSEYTSAGSTHSPFDLPRHRMLDMRGKDTYEYGVGLRTRPQCGNSTSEIGSRKRKGKMHNSASRRAGTDTDTSYIFSQKRRSPDFPPKMIDPHAVRAHPPQRGGVEPEGSTSAGSGSRAFISVSRAKARLGFTSTA